MKRPSSTDRKTPGDPEPGVDERETDRQALEAQVRSSSELLHRAQTLAGIGTYVIDPRAQTIHMSPEMVQLFAAGTEGLTLPLEEYRTRFYHPEELVRAKPRADAAYAAGTPFTIESRVVRRDGKVIWLRASSGPDRNEQGEPIVLGVVQDVTEQHDALEELAAQTQRLQESETRFRTLIDSAPVAIGMSRDGVGLYCNRKFLDLWRYASTDQVVGHPVAGHWAPESQARIAERVRLSAKTGEGMNEDQIAMRADGSRFRAHLDVAVVELPDGPARVAFCVDVTERDETRRKLEERLAFETLLADLTARFLEVPDEEISQAIADAQARTCALFGFDRSSVFEPSDADGGGATSTHVFPDEKGIARKGLAADEYFPWTVERLRTSRRTVVIPDTRELPPQAAVDRESFARIGNITSVSVPWVSPRGEILAIMAFNALRLRELSRDAIREIETAAKVILVALGRAKERRAMAAGQERMRVLTEILDEAPAGILVVDPRGRTLYANRHVAAMHGYTVVELSSLSLFDLIPPEDHPVRRAGIDDVFEKGGASLESWHVRKDGTRIRVHVRILETHWGRQPALLSVQTDLTERDRAEAERRTAEEKRRASERQFASAFEYASIGKTILSLDGSFLRVNRMLCQITGYTEEELLGRRWQDITHGDDVDADLASFRQLAAGAIDSYEIQKRFVHKSGAQLWVLRSASLVRDDLGAPQFIISQIVDITARVRAEEEVDRHRRHLEELVATRTEELRRARDAADEANHAKSRFLANMSHEIRTPMNAILGFAQILLRDPSVTTEQRDHLETINRAGDHLMSLIDGILQLAKVESGHEALSVAPLDLWSLLDDLARLFLTRALDKGLDLALERDDDVPQHVLADAGKLRQIIANLLGNAVKFTSSGRVTVRVRTRTTDDGRRLVVEVADTGPGIDPSERSRLFQKFEQTATGRASNQGTGLGLAISRELVALMHGEIGVESEPGVGTVFRFEVPLTEVPAGQEAPRARPQSRRLAPGQRAFRVLVADDVEDNRTLLVKLLGSAGFETSQCPDGAQAVRRFDEWRPDLVLTDLRMPGMDGLEVIRRVRELAGGDAVKIVCVTASAYDTDEAAAMEAGADAFMKKPVRDVELLARIGELVGARLVDAGEASRATAPARPALSLLVQQLPADLVHELREAATAARARRLEELATRVSGHSEAAAAAIGDLVKQFRYDLILAALQGGPHG